MGSVSSTSMGFKNVLRIPKTIATTMMVDMFSTLTPGTIYDAIKIERLLINRYRSSCMYLG